MAERQLVVAVEGTAAMGPFWPSILSDYLDKIIRCFCGNELTGQKLSGANTELSLVVFNAHGSYSACLVQRSGWTRDLDLFFQWLSSVSFIGGGFSEVAIAEGLAEALLMLSTPNRNQAQQNVDGQKHCILVAASNPYALPTPVSLSRVQNLEQNDTTEPQAESSIYDAEMVAKSFVQCCVSLSIISPKQLPKLKAIFNAGKRNPRAADPVVDNVKNPQFLVLIPENFMEALAALSRPGIAGLASNQNLLKFESQPIHLIPGSTTIPSVNGSMMNRPQISVGTITTATVKVEPITMTSMVSGGSFSHVPSIPHGNSQGVPTLQTSSPSTTSQDMIANGDGMQEFKPLVNGISQPLRPVGPAAANVSILNNLSQARQVMSSASLAGASSMGLPTIGGTSMAIHMSNMISSGMQSSAVPAAQTMLSSGQSGISSLGGSGALVGTAQVTQNSALGSFSSATSNLSGNSNLGVSPPLANLPGVVGMGQSVTNMSGQGNLATGAQIGQSGIGMNQNILNGLGPTGTMIPTPGMSQPVQAGLTSLGVSAVNMPLPQHASGSQQSQSKYLRVWEGALSGQRQGKPVFICKLEGYRNAGSSETLAADWPPTMQIVRLISQDHMNNKQYVGKADFLVFRASNPHGFLSQLQEKKLCAVIQLPSQTLLLSVSDKPSRLIGMLFPGDMVVFKPQISSQQQSQQQQQQQLQQPQQQQQQQPLQQQMMGTGMNQTQQPQQQMIGTGMNQAQQPQQQMMGTGMNQTFVQGQGRPQIMSQGQISSQGPPNMPGGGFLS